MYNKIIRGTRQYKVEEESLLLLEYFMIEKQIKTGEYYYGIEINSQKICPGIRDARVCNHLLLSESKEWVEEIIDQFIGNGVTPATMTYVIDDIMEIPC